jgi:hypothetical protein
VGFQDAFRSPMAQALQYHKPTDIAAVGPLLAEIARSWTWRLEFQDTWEVITLEGEPGKGTTRARLWVILTIAQYAGECQRLTPVSRLEHGPARSLREFVCAGFRCNPHTLPGTKPSPLKG